jgi:hypothetical protein
MISEKNMISPSGNKKRETDGNDRVGIDSLGTGTWLSGV